MRIAAYLALALAFGVWSMLLFRRCAEASPVSLSRGLLVTFCVAIVQVLLFLAGMWTGGLLRFELPDAPTAFSRQNALVMLGLCVLVVARQLLPYFRREPRLPLFALGSNAAVCAMSFATGINLFLVGLGSGFVVSVEADFSKILWSLPVLMFLSGYWGLMLGRQKVAMRPRRWMLISCILVLGVAIAAVVNA